MNTGKILAFVGSSGSGKTTLMQALLAAFPTAVFPILTNTTRAWRGPEDDIFCKFVTREELLRKKETGELAQYREYAGNSYGCEWTDIDNALAKGLGIQAYVESSVFDLRALGYTVLPIKIIADQVNFRTQEREKADKERESTVLDYTLIIHNSFAPGGRESATRELIAFVEHLLNTP